MVFNVSDEESLKAVYSMYAKMAIHRSMQTLPIFLVGSRDGGSRDGGSRDGGSRDGGPRHGVKEASRDRSTDASNGVRGDEGRVLSEVKGRKLAQELKACCYSEVKAEIGFNVDALFNAGWWCGWLVVWLVGGVVSWWCDWLVSVVDW